MLCVCVKASPEADRRRRIPHSFAYSDEQEINVPRGLFYPPRKQSLPLSFVCFQSPPQLYKRRRRGGKNGWQRWGEVKNLRIAALCLLWRPYRIDSGQRCRRARAHIVVRCARVRTCFSFAPHISPLSFTHTVYYYSRELEYYFSRQKTSALSFCFSGFCVLLFCVKCLTLPFRFCCVCDVKKKSTRLENNIGFTLSLELPFAEKQKQKTHNNFKRTRNLYFFEGHNFGSFKQNKKKVYTFCSPIPSTVYRLWSWPFYNLTFGLVHFESVFFRFVCLVYKSSKFCKVQFFFCSSLNIIRFQKQAQSSESVNYFASSSGSVLVAQVAFSSPPKKPTHISKMVRHHQRLAVSSERIEDSSLITSTTSTSSSLMWRRRYGCHCGNVRWPTWPPMLLLLLLVSVETLSLATVTTATRMHYIHWNTTNPM